MTKRIAAILMTILLALSVFPTALAAGTPTVTVSSATAKPGDTVELRASLANNPGINTFSFGFNYDTSRLQLVNVRLADGVGGQFSYSKKAVWLNSSDITTNGDFLLLTMKVLDNATEGDASVAVTYSSGDISNLNEDDVDFALVAGKVTVKPDVPSNGVISVGNVSAAPGETVTVPVTITNNPGINTFSLGFDYNTSVLKLTGVALTSNLGGQFTYGKKAVWLNSTDTTYTGELLILTFQVLETAPEGDTEVAMTYNTGDISNMNEDDLDFNLVSGCVTVLPVLVFDAKAIVGNATGRPGDPVNVYISLDKELDVKSMSIADLSYDHTKLTLTQGEWNVSNSIIDDWNQNDEVGVVTFRENTKQSGKVFLLKFSVLEGLEDCEVTVSCRFNVTTLASNGSEKQLSIENVPGSVTVSNILRGDVNGDDFVNSNDAIHLLYHTLLPDRYTINQNGDFDGDGHVNSNDAIYLLYYTLLPERYPLS